MGWFFWATARIGRAIVLGLKAEHSAIENRKQATVTSAAEAGYFSKCKPQA
jgi:hypothetical protein